MRPCSKKLSDGELAFFRTVYIFSECNCANHSGDFGQCRSVSIFCSCTQVRVQTFCDTHRTFTKHTAQTSKMDAQRWLNSYQLYFVLRVALDRKHCILRVVVHTMRVTLENIQSSSVLIQIACTSKSLSVSSEHHRRSECQIFDKSASVAKIVAVILFRGEPDGQLSTRTFASCVSGVFSLLLPWQGLGRRDYMPAQKPHLSRILVLTSSRQQLSAELDIVNNQNRRVLTKTDAWRSPKICDGSRCRQIPQTK